MRKRDGLQNSKEKNQEIRPEKDLEISQRKGPVKRKLKLLKVTKKSFKKEQKNLGMIYLFQGMLLQKISKKIRKRINQYKNNSPNQRRRKKKEKAFSISNLPPVAD